jgi:hypothetical protein
MKGLSWLVAAGVFAVSLAFTACGSEENAEPSDSLGDFVSLIREGISTDYAPLQGPTAVLEQDAAVIGTFASGFGTTYVKNSVDGGPGTPHLLVEIDVERVLAWNLQGAAPARLLVAIWYPGSADEGSVRSSFPADQRALLILKEVDQESMAANGVEGFPKNQVFVDLPDGIWLELPNGDFTGLREEKDALSDEWGQVDSFASLVAKVDAVRVE